MSKRLGPRVKLTIRVSKPLHKLIVAKAKEHGGSINDFVNTVLVCQTAPVPTLVPEKSK